MEVVCGSVVELIYVFLHLLYNSLKYLITSMRCFSALSLCLYMGGGVLAVMVDQ